MALVPNQKDAAAAVGVTESEFKEMVAMEGFPARRSSGWDIEAIQAWIANATADQATADVADSGLIENPAEPAEESTVPESVEPPPVEHLQLQLPVCGVHSEFIRYGRGHMEVRLRGRELQAFKRLQQGLVLENASLPNGQPVGSATQVIRWLFSRLADELEIPGELHETAATATA